MPRRKKSCWPAAAGQRHTFSLIVRTNEVCSAALSASCVPNASLCSTPQRVLARTGGGGGDDGVPAVAASSRRSCTLCTRRCTCPSASAAPKASRALVGCALLLLLRCAGGAAADAPHHAALLPLAAAVLLVVGAAAAALSNACSLRRTSSMQSCGVSGRRSGWKCQSPAAAFRRLPHDNKPPRRGQRLATVATYCRSVRQAAAVIRAQALRCRLSACPATGARRRVACRQHVAAALLAPSRLCNRRTARRDAALRSDCCQCTPKRGSGRVAARQRASGVVGRPPRRLLLRQPAADRHMRPKQMLFRPAARLQRLSEIQHQLRWH